jgi:pimeloyl-ACP methyl ester carboxylesterase
MRTSGRNLLLALPVMLSLLLLALGSGCGGIGVRPSGSTGLFDSWRVSASDDTLSRRTMQTLHRHDLARLCQQYPEEAFHQLQAVAETEPTPEVLFALAEFSHLLGTKCERHAGVKALGYYYLCAGYCYHYLFGSGGDLSSPRSPDFSGGGETSAFDPRFRLACDLYNASLARCVQAAQEVGRPVPGYTLRLPTTDGQGFTLSVVHHGFPWKPEEFGPLLPCDDYQAVGLAHQHRTFGLGVPLVVVRAKDAPNPGHSFYPPAVSFPATAFFRFEGNLADLRARRSGRLELYNPLVLRTVRVHGTPVPLETNLTTPLAYFLSQMDLDAVGVAGFLSPEKVQRLSGIYLIEPYQPGKIPVIFVHGLLSSPMTFAGLFNDLRADPVLRARYQFWFYLYPSANPFLTTAAELREALAEVRARLDLGQDPALDRMVLVGHSMGGLVSKLMTVSSGNQFWQQVSERPFEELKASPETKEALRRIFFFEPVPSVRRVIYVGTPHRGSKLSPSLPGRLARRLIRMPGDMQQLAKDLVQANPGLGAGGKSVRVPTSIDLLAPGSPALEVLASLPTARDVHYHSIIGQAPTSTSVWLARFFSGNRGCEEDDGVVPYASAHVEEADSELVVPAEHMVIHHHPRAVQEIRRILLEHLPVSRSTAITQVRPVLRKHPALHKLERAACLPLAGLADDLVVKGITLDRDAAGFLDNPPDVCHAEFLGRVTAGVVVDLLVNDGAVQVIGAEGQGHLGRLDAQHHPVRLDVREVVQHQPADGHRLQVEQDARFLNTVHLGQLCVVRVEGQGDEGLEAARLVLQFPQPDQVVDAVPDLLDVPVEHGGVGAQTQIVRLVVNPHPGVGIGLVLADPVADLWVEDLGAAAGQTAQTCLLELGQQLPCGATGQSLEPVPLDGSVSLEVKSWVSLVDDADNVQIPLIGELMVQPADDV